MNDKRTKSIRIRVTSEEHDMFSERSGDLSISDWIRLTCFGGKKARIKKFRKIDKAFIYQLSGIGNNLNQIAKVVNTKKNQFDRIWVLDQLAGIKKELRDLRKDLEYGRRIS